jgi:hypothetical protein
MRAVYVPQFQPQRAPHRPFWMHALASIAALAAFGAMVLVWSIGLGA